MKKTEDKLKMIHIRLKPEDHKKVRQKCLDEDTTMQEYVFGLIEADLNKKKKGGRNVKT